MSAFHEVVAEFREQKKAEEEAALRTKMERLSLLGSKGELLSAFVRDDPDFLAYLKSVMNEEKILILAETIFGTHTFCHEICDREWSLILALSTDCTYVQLGIRSDTPCDPLNIPDPVWVSFLPVLEKLRNERLVCLLLFEKYPPEGC